MNFKLLDRHMGVRSKKAIKARAKGAGYDTISGLVHDLFCVKRAPVPKIATVLGVSPQTVYRWAAAWGFPVRQLVAAPPSGTSTSSFTGRTVPAPWDKGTVLGLWGAVLKQAANDALRGRGDAVRWFYNAGADDNTGSFLWIAEVLKIDPGVLRARMLKGAINGQ